jgi:hypothetical protein
MCPHRERYKIVDMLRYRIAQLGCSRADLLTYQPNRVRVKVQPNCRIRRANLGGQGVVNFSNDGVVVGSDPLKPRLDLWRKILDKDH